MNKLTQLLKSEEFLLLDGAMGTMLMSAGLEQGAPPESWNFLHPDRVRKVHRDYIQAGSRIILSNSFGGSRYRLKLHNLDDQVGELNRAAAELARTEAEATGYTVVVGGSMGPTGELLEPLGSMAFEDATAAFAEQARGLAEGGVDVLWIETMSDLGEVKAAIEGARSVTDLPIVATLSFDTRGRTMMGVTANQVVEELRRYNLLAIGANCGANILDTEAAVNDMRLSEPDMLIVAKANAGIPRWEENELIYNGTPQVMADFALRARAMGAQLIGACCGSTAKHIKAMADALADPEARAAAGAQQRLQGDNGRSPSPQNIKQAATGRQRRHLRRRRPRARD